MEYFDVCDADGRPTGEIVERAQAHRMDIRHRTAHVWIVRDCGGRTQVLLQKRSAHKDSFPGKFDTSSAGHIPAGCEPLESALRELKEELGIEALPEQLDYAGHFDIHYEKEFYGKPFRDNEYTFVYVYTGPVDADRVVCQPEEVECVRWFDLQEVRDEIRHDRTRFCVPAEGLDVLIGYLQKHQSQAARHA